MSHVKATALKPFTYKGEQYNKGDEVTFTSANGAKTYANTGFVKFDSETKEKVETAIEKQAEKKSNAGPNAKK